MADSLQRHIDFFNRYSDNRLGLIKAENKADIETITQTLVNTEMTVLNLLRVLNNIGITDYNGDALPDNVKRLVKALDIDGLYKGVFDNE